MVLLPLPFDPYLFSIEQVAVTNALGQKVLALETRSKFMAVQNLDLQDRLDATFSEMEARQLVVYSRPGCSKSRWLVIGNSVYPLYRCVVTTDILIDSVPLCLNVIEGFP